MAIGGNTLQVFTPTQWTQPPSSPAIAIRHQALVLFTRCTGDVSLVTAGQDGGWAWLGGASLQIRHIYKRRRILALYLFLSPQVRLVI